MTRVNMFVDMDTELVKESSNKDETELVEGSKKRAGTELEQEVAKKQKIDNAKVDDDQEEARMKELMNIKLVKAKHGSTRPEEGYERVLLEDLMIITLSEVVIYAYLYAGREKTKIYIDNESTICIVKNPVFHSKTKHIKIRHHFIRDSNEKKLIQMIRIHTDQNVADLLTKAFDVSRFQYLIASIGMLNL
ncbi:hypothetical protein Tco_1521037 [Tanacetum coccineum]